MGHSIYKSALILFAYYSSVSVGEVRLLWFRQRFGAWKQWCCLLVADDIIVFAPKCRRFVVDFLRISHLPPIVFHLHMFYIPFSAWRIWPLLIICFSVLFFLHTYIRQVFCPILLGIKAYIIEIKTWFYSLLIVICTLIWLAMQIVEVVKTGGNIQLKGGCYNMRRVLPFQELPN